MEPEVVATVDSWEQANPCLDLDGSGRAARHERVSQLSHCESGECGARWRELPGHRRPVGRRGPPRGARCPARGAAPETATRPAPPPGLAPDAPHGAPHSRPRPRFGCSVSGRRDHRDHARERAAVPVRDLGGGRGGGALPWSRDWPRRTGWASSMAASVRRRSPPRNRRNSSSTGRGSRWGRRGRPRRGDRRRPRPEHRPGGEPTPPDDMLRPGDLARRLAAGRIFAPAPESASETRTALEAVVERMRATDPAERPTAGEVVARLSELLASPRLVRTGSFTTIDSSGFLVSSGWSDRDNPAPSDGRGRDPDTARPIPGRREAGRGGDGDRLPGRGHRRWDDGRHQGPPRRLGRASRRDQAVHERGPHPGDDQDALCRQLHRIERGRRRPLPRPGVRPGTDSAGLVDRGRAVRGKNRADDHRGRRARPVRGARAGDHPPRHQAR